MPTIVSDDDSTPCCKDFSRLLKEAGLCATGPSLGAGATGGLGAPVQGSFGYTLNATAGGPGGGSGASWLSITPIIAEAWS